MSDLGIRLERLGLAHYLEVFVSEGFDTWETLLDVTESDLNALNVKLGHRRKLQRAIAESRGQSADRPLPIALREATSIDGSYRSDDSATEGKAKQADPSTSIPVGTSTKRKYRRHPKPDEHAPERPPSAYVIFSNQVRETLRGQDLSFTEIAKVVGERWQVLPADRREECERQANSAKEKYYAELAEYKKTPEYENYQKYLEEFKAKHAAPQKSKSSSFNRGKSHNTGEPGSEGKRSKLETETSTSTRSSSHDQTERSSSNRRISSTQSDAYSIGHAMSESSPLSGPARLPSAPSYPSEATSPAGHPLSRINSPRMGDHYSPVSASPRSATLHKENSFDFQPSALGREPRAQSDSNLPYSASSYGHARHPSSTTPPNAPFSSHYASAPVDLPSRRSFREPTRLPPLTHEDTTISSDGSYSNSNPHYPPPNLVPVDVSKSSRTLPQPVPTLGAAPSPLDRPMPLASASTQQPQQPDYRGTSSLAALLRAGELARVADDEVMKDEGSP